MIISRWAHMDRRRRIGMVTMMIVIFVRRTIMMIIMI